MGLQNDATNKLREMMLEGKLGCDPESVTTREIVMSL